MRLRGCQFDSPQLHTIFLRNYIEISIAVDARKVVRTRSVGLNAVGAEGSAAAYGIFSRGWALEAAAGNKSKPPDVAVVAVATFEMGHLRQCQRPNGQLFVPVIAEGAAHDPRGNPFADE